MNRIWSETDKEFIRQNVQFFTDDMMSVKLSQIKGKHVSVHAVRKMRQSMGLKKSPGRGVCRLAEASPKGEPHAN